MKRNGNLFDRIISMENLLQADYNACKGKYNQIGVVEHIARREENLTKLHRLLAAGEFWTSIYSTFIVREPKERVIFRLPYYPDRIVHHAIMNVMEPIWVGCFTADTYACIKGRGIHSALANVKKALRDTLATQYCLKLDIQKFYQSVDHDVLKMIIRKKIKDARLLNLLDGIIDSADGLPIGNYLSQYLANLYLTYFDHWLKEVKKVRYYFRYCDDMVILGSSKAYLHELKSDIAEYLQVKLKLTLKSNHQVFPVASRGIDFVGYVTYHTHTRLRKSIKKNFARAVAKRKPLASLHAYRGWAMYANSKNLIRKLIPDYGKAV